MKFMILIVLFSSSVFSKSDKIECLKKMQTSFIKLELEKTKTVGMNVPSRKPTDFIISDTNEIAWLDGKGSVRVSSEKGSVIVSGRGCNSSSDLNSNQTIQLSYDYMSQYKPSDWLETKKFCNSLGFKSVSEMMASQGSYLVSPVAPPKSNK